MPYPHNADWSLIPEHMREGLKLYIDHGIPPGHFMTAVLTNDLREACARADDINRRALLDIVFFLVNYAPSACWGSPEKVSAWLDDGGLNRVVEAAPRVEA